MVIQIIAFDWISFDNPLTLCVANYLVYSRMQKLVLQNEKGCDFRPQPAEFSISSIEGYWMV